jgi:hypothetical protein
LSWYGEFLPTEYATTNAPGDLGGSQRCDWTRRINGMCSSRYEESLRSRISVCDNVVVVGDAVCMLVLTECEGSDAMRWDGKRIERMAWPLVGGLYNNAGC